MIAAMNSTSGYTTYRGQEFTGTSAATPVAAGFGALLLSAHHEWSNQDALNKMIETADDLGAPGFDNLFGHGRINMAKAFPVVKEGDYNQDGKVNNLDVQVVKSHYGARTGDSNFIVAADGNSDGTIDELDVFPVARNWGS
jgi:subtilisin family serine protease